MSAVIDFPAPEDDDFLHGVPCDMDAEQAVLGAVLFDNAVLDRLGQLEAGHFYDPVHARVFDRAQQQIGRGSLADPVGIASALKADPGLAELGGLRFLAKLVERAFVPAAIAHAKIIVDMALRRRLIQISDAVGLEARRGSSPGSDQLEAAERALLELQVQDRPMQFTTAGRAAQDVLHYIDKPEDHAGGLLTGLAPLDQQMGPMMPGDLIVLGGRTAMGKSALAAVIASNAAAAGQGIIEINGEMSVGQMMRRHLTSLAFDKYNKRAPAYSAIRKREITYDQRQMLEWAADEIEARPLVLMKRTGLRFSGLRSLVRRQRAEWDRAGIRLGAVVIDHAGLVRPDTDNRSRYEDQTIISNGLKEMADELQIVVIALAQLNREPDKRDNKRPMLSDLRDSGAWEQDADVVLGIYRDAYYAQREPEPKTTSGKVDAEMAWAEWDRRRRSKTVEAILLKVREGETGLVELWGDMATNSILGADPGDGGMF